MKKQSGITLIALIITIIVLLILAVVAIRAVQGDGIIAHAKNAKSEYELAQANEEAALQNYMDFIAEELEVEEEEVYNINFNLTRMYIRC